jgi:hypothetical protein
MSPTLQRSRVEAFGLERKGINRPTEEAGESAPGDALVWV